MKNGSKKKRAWTTEQVRDLKSLARKKTPAKKIAKSLKRTEGATRQKAFSVGLSLDSRAYRPQTDKAAFPANPALLPCAGLFHERASHRSRPTTPRHHLSPSKIRDVKLESGFSPTRLGVELGQ